MTKTKIIISVLSGAIALFTMACSTGNSATEVAPAAPQPDTVEVVPLESNPVAAPQPEVVPDTTAATISETDPASAAIAGDEAEASTGSVVVETNDNLTEAQTAEVTSAAVPFTGVIGLADFSAYRLDFDAIFEGQRSGQPSAGALGGLFEVTRNPEAQHWQVTMAGDMFSQFAALGSNTVELYDLGNTVYIQNPQDGGFIGMPAFLVDSMLPAEIYAPEEIISLPLTAVPHSGVEMVNGVATQRFTFGSTDLPAEAASYEAVDGTIWVALEGNYVVKYQATITGQFEDMATAGVELLDEGTVSMVYNLTDVNGDFTIDAPAGATALDLGKFIFN